MTTDSRDGPSSVGARIVGSVFSLGPGPEVLAAATLVGDKVMSCDGEHVGKISAIMLEVRTGRIAYAVLSTERFSRIRGTLHAIPWSALTLDAIDKCFVIDIPTERLKDEPGFDRDHWSPDGRRNMGGRSPCLLCSRTILDGHPRCQRKPHDRHLGNPALPTV